MKLEHMQATTLEMKLWRIRNIYDDDYFGFLSAGSLADHPNTAVLFLLMFYSRRNPDVEYDDVVRKLVRDAQYVCNGEIEYADPQQRFMSVFDDLAAHLQNNYA